MFLDQQFQNILRMLFIFAECFYNIIITFKQHSNNDKKTALFNVFRILQINTHIRLFLSINKVKRILS